MAKVQKYVVTMAFAPTLKVNGKPLTYEYKVGEEINETQLEASQIAAFISKGYIVKGDLETVKQIQDEDNSLIAFRKIVAILKDVTLQDELYDKIKEEVSYFVDMFNTYKPKDILPQEPVNANKDKLPEEPKTGEDEVKVEGEAKSSKGSKNKDK